MQFKLENAFATLRFEVKNERAYVTRISFSGKDYYNFPKGNVVTQMYLTDGVYPGKNYGKYCFGGENLLYVAHDLQKTEGEQVLCIEEKNEKVGVKTYFTLLDNGGVVNIYKEVTNISAEEFDLECVNVVTLTDILFFDCKSEIEAIVEKIPHRFETEDFPVLWKAHNNWCTEAVFEKIDLVKEGMRKADMTKRAGKYNVTSNGSQSTCRYLPLGILEKENYGYFMFEITPSGSWSYEIEAGSRDLDDSEITLAVTCKNLYDNGWYKCLKAGETYTTDSVKIVGAFDLDGLLKQVTTYRRSVKKAFRYNGADYVIYNNFQQNTYDRPTEDTDVTYMNVAKEFGADFYVIDAGWHDNCEGCSPTQKIGEWEENVASYPSGVKVTGDRVRELGMKFGLWVELQSVGIFCKDKNLLPEECFFHVHGKRPVTNRRYHLDFTKPQVREFAEKIIDKMVTRYSPNYIKIDYNQTTYGNDCEDGSLAEGLAKHVRAYNKWFVAVQDKYPEIIFESCASGGMNLDWSKGEITNLFSVTDSGAYYMYPYILSNVVLATLPEQNGVWNMPLRKYVYPKVEENVEHITSDEEVIMNAVNSFYAVMHLSSKLQFLSDAHKALVQEGIDYYRSLCKVKQTAIPVMPKGLTNLDDKTVVTGIKTEEKLYLSVYNIAETGQTVTLDLNKYKAVNATLVYPKASQNAYSLQDGVLKVEMGKVSARAFEFDIKK